MIPEKDDGENFDDCPLVVVPDYVADEFVQNVLYDT
jgi:hypothetical protein